MTMKKLTKKQRAKRAQKVYNKFMFDESARLLVEIRDIQQVLKMHGEAHAANDLLPQFTALCEKVETLQVESKLKKAPKKVKS